ncbi:hypothetical protein D6783_04915 [Candidatus Woesearchaeota archaeon]|nr:MAG: hypothetical protein D6783_04915 [Candidatus Woesearchaeota archaeon]
MEIEPKRLIVGMTLVFLLGISFAIVNGFYVQSSGEALPLVVYGLAFLSLLVGASVMLLFQWKINKAQVFRLVKLLPPEERVIVKILLEHNNRLEQNYVVALSGLSKVKVSRILARLSERGVVEKKPLGNTNLVVLKV